VLVESVLSCLAALRGFFQTRGEDSAATGAPGPAEDGPKIAEEVRVLIRRLANENPDWGAPKIHGELQKLGFVVSESSVARYLRRIRRRGDPGRRWLAFLQNHREAVVAFDFFTVPTVKFQLLYCFFVIQHARRRILHFNVTRHPLADWVVQQLRATFPQAGSYRYVILDRDAKFNDSVTTFLQATGLTPKRTSLQSPWQNGTAERWIGSCRRELLDYIIAWNERHLLSLLRDYVSSAITTGIGFTTRWERTRRRAERSSAKPKTDATVISLPRLGGLHHRYSWREAA
jgi:hypothetical protein